MKACEVLKKYGISRVTLGRWVKFGRISCERLPSGHWNYISPLEKYSQEVEQSRKNVIYCRVSTSGQKENLKRQVERVRSFVSSSGFLVDEVYQEVGSALNYNRKFYRKLFKEITEKKISNVFVEYKDIMLRVGFDDFVELCKLHGTKITVIDNSIVKSTNSEIVEDMIAIIHHFSSKMYSSRKRKKLQILVEEVLQDV